MEKLRRVFAVVMILVILGLVIWACILGATGSSYFPAALFLCILVPVLFYGISLMTRLLAAKGKEMAEEAKDETENPVEKQEVI